MTIFFHILIFLISCFILAFSSKWLVNTLIRICKFLCWKEFVVAFFIMAFGVSIPNFFVGVISALNKVPELSLGDVIGGNITDLTLIIGIAALFSKVGISAPSRTVQGSSAFTIGIALLPLILITDGVLSRGDSILLFLSFFGYVSWLFSKEERFKKVYDEVSEPLTIKFFVKNLIFFLFSLIFLLLAAKGIVNSAVFFSNYFNFPIVLIGILVVGLGNCLPELFFSVEAAKKGQDWLILGDLVGCVVITATLVLGVVGLICPIKITDFSLIAISRIFLIISAICFLIFLRTGHRITKKEAMILLVIYFIFVITEILTKY